MPRRSDGAGRFIAEFELSVTPHAAKVLKQRLEAGRMIYNALLDEALKRHRLYRESRMFQRAKRIPKRTAEQREARRAAFRSAREAWGWTEYGLTGHLQTFGKQFTSTWLNQLVDSQIVKKLAERVARTVLAYSFGAKGRPHFKRKGAMMSLEGINNLQSIRVKVDEQDRLYVHWGAGRGSEPLTLPLVVDPGDVYHRHALDAMSMESGLSGLKFTRIVRRIVRGRDRFFAQLVLVGRPYQRDQLHRIGVVGLDIGPSTIAIVGEDVVQFQRFCDELGNREREIRILQRHIDRQRRANNPDCFDAQGRWIKGKRATNVSGRMRWSLARVRTIRQQQTDHRKSLHGQLVRQVLGLGSDFRMERLSYRAFQRAFGRSVLARAPGLFVGHLKRKGGEIGALVNEFSTYSTRLSQVCLCGRSRKKRRNERVHACECGIRAHRDLFSGYLARFVDDDLLDVTRASLDWHRFRDRVTVA